MTALQEPLQRETSARKNQIALNSILIGTFALLAAYFMVWPIWRSQFLIEIWLTEGWNAYFQDAAASGARLYPRSDSLTVNNYPPLSFYVIGTLGKLFGDNLFVGRWVSIAGLLGAASAIFFCIRTLTAGGTTGAAIGALWYVAIMAHNSAFYVGANDPQIAGEAIMATALAWFLVRDKAGKAVEPALLLMVLGGFWKHNMLAVPVATVIWLVVDRGTKAARPIAVSAIAVILGLSLCVTIFGRDFIDNLLTLRHYGLSNLLMNIGHLQWSALAFFIWLLWAVADRSRAAAFTAILVTAGLASCILQWFGHNIFGNAEFDFIVALAIGLGVAHERMGSSWLAKRIGTDPVRVIVVIILVLRLVATTRHEPAWVIFDPQFRSSLYDTEHATRREAGMVAAIPGQVYCANKVVCRLAGKPLIVDDFVVEELVATGRATNQEIAAMLAARNITIVGR